MWQESVNSVQISFVSRWECSPFVVGTSADPPRPKLCCAYMRFLGVCCRCIGGLDDFGGEVTVTSGSNCTAGQIEIKTKKALNFADTGFIVKNSS
jgi:hypothetical protein